MTGTVLSKTRFFVLGAERNSQPAESTALNKSFMPDEQEVLEQDAMAQGDETENSTEETQVDEQEKPEVKVEAPKERPVFTMPVQKAQEEKKRAVEKAKAEAKAEADAEIARVKAEYEAKMSQGTDDIDKELERVAEEHNLDKDGAKKLLDVFKKSIKVPDVSRYESILKQAEEEKVKSQVRAVIDTSVVPLIKNDFPDATPEQIANIAEQVNGLAFTDDFKGYRIEDIYRVKRDEFSPKNGFSVEGSKGRSPTIVDFSNLSDEDEHQLAEKDPETFKKYLEYQESKSSRYLN